MVNRRNTGLVSLIVVCLGVACSQKKIETKTMGVPAPPPTIEVVDEWNLRLDSPVDVIFFGDTSGSMTAKLETMGEKVTPFVEGLLEYTDDWQLMAVTGPDGCGVNGILTPEIPDYATLFAEGIVTPPGDDFVDEWGLHNALKALEQSIPGGCNEGFLRAGTRLHVIFISDEDDNSPGWNTEPGYWRTYLTDIQNRMKSPEQLMLSGVIGPVTNSCDGVEPGHGYLQAIEETGGEILSICDEWQNDIDRLVNATVAYPLFPLSLPPIEDSIRIEVNDQEQEGNWHYQPGTNTVFFDESEPKLGDAVRIIYRTYEIEE